MGRLFLDGAAGSPVRPEVAARMAELLREGVGNPNGGHAEARRSRAILDAARDSIAERLGTIAPQVVFTGTASEALALALGSELAADGLLVTTAAEHRGARALAARHAAAGGVVRLVPLDREGRWDLAAADRSGTFANLSGATALLTLASGELGTVQPLADFVRAWRTAGGGAIVLDGVQEAIEGPLDLAALGVEHLIVGSAKLAGPVGISVVASAPGRQLRPIVVGGGQERGRRGGTEAVLLADALALALRLAQEEAPRRCPAVRAIADRFDATLGDPLALGLQPTGPREARDRLCGHRSFAAGWALGDDLVAALDHEGLAASTGSACLSGSREPSEALLACGVDEASARGGLRLSFDAHHVAADAERAAQALRRVGERLRGAVAAR